MNPSPRRALAMGSASRLSVALTQCAVHCVARIFAGLCPTRPYPNPKPVIERTSLRRLSLLAVHACARTRAVGLEHARRRAHFSGESRQSLARLEAFSASCIMDCARNAACEASSASVAAT